MKISEIKKYSFLRKINTAIQSGNKKAAVLFFAVIIIFQVAAIIYSANNRNGFFIDELYSFGLSNSVGHAFLNKDVSIHNKWVEKEYFHKYLTVQPDERFSYSSVYRNQIKDCHPPLYYFVLHTICSFFPDKYSNWHGFTLNIAIFVLCQIFLARISMQITNRNVWLSAAILVLYGGTLLALNNVLFIRMYMLLTLWAVISAALHLSILDNGFSTKRGIMLWLITFAGCMTQYYFGIYSFFIAATLGIYFLFKKKWLLLFSYSVTMLLAVVAFLLAYPAVFKHIFSGQRVVNKTLENATKIFQIPYKCLIYAYNFAAAIFTNNAIINLSIIAILFIAVAFMLILLFKRKGKNILTAVFNGNFCFLAISITGCFVTVALLSFGAITRYMYFIHPLLVLLAAVFLMTLVRSMFEKHKNLAFLSEILFLMVAICLSLNCIVSRKMNLHHCEIEFLNQNLLKQYRNSYGIFITKRNVTAPLTQECRAVMQLQGIYCMEQVDCKNIDKIMSGKPSKPLIVWIDINNHDPQKTVEEILNNNTYSHAEKLYSFGLVDCYIFN